MHMNRLTLSTLTDMALTHEHKTRVMFAKGRRATCLRVSCRRQNPLVSKVMCRGELTSVPFRHRDVPRRSSSSVIFPDAWQPCAASVMADVTGRGTADPPLRSHRPTRTHHLGDPRAAHERGIASMRVHDSAGLLRSNDPGEDRHGSNSLRGEPARTLRGSTAERSQRPQPGQPQRRAGHRAIARCCRPRGAHQRIDEGRGDQDCPGESVRTVVKHPCQGQRMQADDEHERRDCPHGEAEPVKHDDRNRRNDPLQSVDRAELTPHALKLPALAQRDQGVTLRRKKTATRTPRAGAPRRSRGQRESRGAHGRADRRSGATLPRRVRRTSLRWRALLPWRVSGSPRRDPGDPVIGTPARRPRCSGSDEARLAVAAAVLKKILIASNTVHFVCVADISGRAAPVVGSRGPR